MSNSPKGVLKMIPVGLTAESVATIPVDVAKAAVTIQHYFVENIRTARRFLKQFDKSVDIDAISFSEINQHSEPDFAKLKEWLSKGFVVGVMSEAGCPGVADPGSALAGKAQELGFKIEPLVGPNSILLALMASGFNGQKFRFNGYLPVKNPERNKFIHHLAKTAKEEMQTEIFIETPYRNEPLFEDLLKNLPDNYLLCIACNITAPDEFIKTQKIADWKKNGLKTILHKKPTIFLFSAI